MGYNEWINSINDNMMNVRLDSLKNLIDYDKERESGHISFPEYVNNHIHTTFSFSPYSPSKAIWAAYQAGLLTAGIMDHDTIGGAPEFIHAGKIAGVATTVGLECRTDFSKTVLEGRRLNNPDQVSSAYIGIHGVPHTMIEKLDKYFRPFSEERGKRTGL